MSHEARQWISYEALTEAAGAEAAARDRDGAFPAAAFDGLRQLGLIGAPPLRLDEASQLFRVLAAVGRGDLSVGRIFEGHVNALFLIDMFGRAEQRAHYRTLAAGGALFGVWNTDATGSAVALDDGHLRGKKNFASGVDGLSYALITVATPRGRQMAVVAVGGRPVDRSWWRPLGMRASGSHVVDFAGIPFHRPVCWASPTIMCKSRGSRRAQCGLPPSMSVACTRFWIRPLPICANTSVQPIRIRSTGSG